ncbi:MAG: endonuclease MutS2 [Lachnospiraceae bacterium]|nr:endonuclease MutS2 [Lachnospiraceae bacterium]
MNEKSLITLEYHKITERLAQYASSTAGKELCLRLLPSDSLPDIELAQTETKDALTRIYKKGGISFSGLKDIRASMKRLEIGSTLNIEELLSINKLLEITKRIKTYSRKEHGDDTEDSLDERFRQLEPLTPLSAEISRCIISEDEISDEASPTLRHTRRSIKSMNDKIRSQMNSLLNSSSMRTYLQDSVITMRGDRYCLPVKAEYRSQVPGMIHDQSSTGSTLFVEPMAVVKLNNDLKQLFLKEQEEIEVILATLSQQVSEYMEEILCNYELLVQLDFIFAKAFYAQEYKGTRPIFNSNGYISIRDGRHPLLDPQKVVPITIYLGKEFDLLIVTGPNTGGKTVSLKTVGLFTLMGQAGLHIPAHDGSELSVFTNVFADIGDEQSIEQNLSTFSSHMTNIVSILKKVDQRSLVLFDELGGGTDPTEGAALAIAILSHLHQRGIRTMATTHYSELKVFALGTEFVENASCEFSVETLQPTYRLLIGIPGKSNAFAISKKLGLPNYIINDAKKHISSQDETFEDLIADLEQSRRTIEKERLEIQEYKNEVKQLTLRIEKKEGRLDEQKENILRNANEEARKILAEAKAFADQTMKDFQKFGKENVSVKEMEQKRSELRSRMSHTEKGMALKTPERKKEHKPSDFRIGDTVHVYSMNLKGTISSLPNAKGMVMVQMGILRSQLPISDLEILPDEAVTVKKSSKSSSGGSKMSKAASISPEINLLGMTVDEAVAVLDKYLDDAYLTHLQQVRVVHGKGTGALRQGIHQYLRRLKYVKNFRLGEFGEGDAGVTIVEFK